jgi:hypothetical protein
MLSGDMKKTNKNKHGEAGRKQTKRAIKHQIQRPRQPRSQESESSQAISTREQNIKIRRERKKKE